MIYRFLVIAFAIIWQGCAGFEVRPYEEPDFAEVCWSGQLVQSYNGDCEAPEIIQWEKVPISVYVEAEEWMDQDIRAALGMWRRVRPGLFVQVDDPLAADIRVYMFSNGSRPGSNTVHFRDDGGRLRSRIACSDCVLRGLAYEVLAHEFGHALGLAHDPQTPTSIMFPRYSDPLGPQEFKKVTLVDTMAIQELYGY